MGTFDDLTALAGVSRITLADNAPRRQDAVVVECEGPVSAPDCRTIIDTLKTMWPDRLVLWKPAGAKLLGQPPVWVWKSGKPVEKTGS